MADIIDAFVVSLGIDSSEYNREIRKYREDRKRLAEEEQKQNRASQDGQSRTIAGLRTLRNETAGFLLMLAGASSVVGFAKDLLTADANTARFARNIGMTTERLSVWENALKRVGGTAQEAQQALGTLYDIYQNRKFTGDMSKSGPLALFGLSEEDLKDPEAALLKLAEAAKNIPREELEWRLKQLGLSGSIVGLLAGDRGELTKLLASVEAAGVANDESAEAAMNLEAEMAETAQTMRTLARPAVTELAGAFTELLGVVNDLIQPLADVRDFFAAITESNLYKLLVGAPDYKDIFDYLGDAAGGEIGENFKRKWGHKGQYDARRGGSSMIGGLIDYALGVTTGGNPRPPGGPRSRDIPRTRANVEAYFRGAGFSPEQVKGIVASVIAEGGLGRRTGGGHKGRALGIGQLLGSRRDKFLDRYGKDFTFQNELDFMYEEMHRGDGKFVGRKVRQMNDPAAIAKLMVDDFYRPKKGAETWGDYRRAARDLRMPVGSASAGRPSVSQSSVTTIGAINVYTPATDATGIVRDIKGEMHKRGLVVQAGSGLRP